MRILLITRGKFLRHPELFFKTEYNGVKTNPVVAGGFGWFWEKALKSMGHEVTTFMYFQNPSLDHSSRLEEFTLTLKNKISLLKKAVINSTNSKFVSLCQAYKPELILMDAGEYILPESLNKVKLRTKTKIVNWLLDDPFRQDWKNIIDSAAIYDCIFVFDPFYIERLKGNKGICVKYLACACDPDIHRTYQLEETEISRLKSGLCFIGSLTQSRIRLLTELDDFDLGIWTYWKKAIKQSPLLYKNYRGIAWGEDASKILNCCQIALNFHHEQSVYGLNMKTFEIAGCGAFQLVDNKRELGNIFELGKEMICYENIKQLKDLIEYFLKNQKESREIAERAQAKVIREHTYKHRLSKLIETVKSL
jgi:spore maturation protein CgeB